MSIDDVETARRATEHLLSLGHTRIVHLGGDPERADGLPGARPAPAPESTEAMDAAGLADEIIFQPAVFSIPGGYEAALSRPRRPAFPARPRSWPDATRSRSA